MDTTDTKVEIENPKFRIIGKLRGEEASVLAHSQVVDVRENGKAVTLRVVGFQNGTLILEDLKGENPREIPTADLKVYRQGTVTRDKKLDAHINTDKCTLVYEAQPAVVRPAKPASAERLSAAASYAKTKNLPATPENNPVATQPAVPALASEAASAETPAPQPPATAAEPESAAQSGEVPAKTKGAVSSAPAAATSEARDEIIDSKTIDKIAEEAETTKDIVEKVLAAAKKVGVAPAAATPAAPGAQKTEAPAFPSQPLHKRLWKKVQGWLGKVKGWFTREKKAETKGGEGEGGAEKTPKAAPPEIAPEEVIKNTPEELETKAREEFKKLASLDEQAKNACKAATTREKINIDGTLYTIIARSPSIQRPSGTSEEMVPLASEYLIVGRLSGENYEVRAARINLIRTTPNPWTPAEGEKKQQGKKKLYTRSNYALMDNVKIKEK